MPTENYGEIKGNSKIIKFLTGLLCIMFPVGLGIMLTDLGQPYVWTTTIFLGLQALILFLLLIRFSNLRSAVISSLFIIILSFATEYTGVNTAYPFGSYVYGSKLIPVAAGVPLAITFAWFSVTLSSLLTVKFFLPGLSSLTSAFISAILILASDILLEPFASFVNVFWIWDNNTIPVANFISWFILGFIFSYIVDRITEWNEAITIPVLYAAPLIIFSINILNFTIINLIHQYYLFIIAGLAVTGIELLFLYKYRSHEA